MALTERVLHTIRRHALARADTRVLVALSGGADSVAVLFLLRELEAAGQLRIAGAAHLNHQLRGADADEDEVFCAGLASRLGVPFVAERANVRALAKAQKRSLEDAARVARYAFLDRAADGLAADAIAVAHTKDDQAETFLLRLLRGAGTRGLAAIHPRHGRVIRPVLDVGRADLRDYLNAVGEPFRDDVSNADVAILRNRVRHELLPLLQTRFSPRVVDALASEAALARQDEEYLAAQAIELSSRVVLVSEAPRRAIRLDVRGLSSAPPALASRVALGALRHLAGGRQVGYEHVERLMDLAADNVEGRPGRGDAARALSLPGQHAIRLGNEILLSPGRGGRAETNSFAFLLSIPGEVQSGGWTIAAEPLPESDDGQAGGRRWEGRGAEVGIAAGAVALPLGIRNRRPGDRFRPLGAPGVRKLQDFLVDRKVARGDRERLPLVVDARDRIVWVPGQSVAEDFRVHDPSRGVILLKVRRLGGTG